MELGHIIFKTKKKVKLKKQLYLVYFIINMILNRRTNAKKKKCNKSKYSG